MHRTMDKEDMKQNEINTFDPCFANILLYIVAKGDLPGIKRYVFSLNNHIKVIYYTIIR